MCCVFLEEYSNVKNCQNLARTIGATVAMVLGSPVDVGRLSVSVLNSGVDGLIMFLVHTLLCVLGASSTTASTLESCSISDVVFIARHMTGLSVETHFFYVDKSVADAAVPTDPVEKFRHFSGRQGGEDMMARSYSKSSLFSLSSAVTWSLPSKP
jgi:hypothetical protein